MRRIRKMRRSQRDNGMIRMIVSNSYKYCGFIRASKGDGGGTDIAEYISSCAVSPSNSARTSVARFGNRKIKK